MQLPARRKLRKLKLEPMCRKSKTETAKTDPKRARPNAARELPKRAWLRRARLEPRWSLGSIYVKQYDSKGGGVIFQPAFQPTSNISIQISRTSLDMFNVLLFSFKILILILAATSAPLSIEIHAILQISKLKFRKKPFNCSNQLRSAKFSKRI